MPATSAALHLPRRVANQSTGNGATHMSGQTGFSPLPKYIIVAVAAHASFASTTLSNLPPNTM
jgi:hypothetical protein